jgi:glycosyltransferase involved in cell wall biosynthesis
MSRPLVSIILPVYNGQRYLRGAVESCRQQTYDNWELILVDDASTDATPRIIAELAAADARIRSIRHETNRRLPAALNTGFAASRGEYLTWTSDDNLYEPDAIELMVASLESNPDVGLVYCNVTNIGPDGEDYGVRQLPGPDAFPENGWICACFLYRREVYEAIGDYNPDMVLVEDFEYFLRVHRRFKMLHRTDVAPYAYRYHPHSLTSTNETRIKLQKARAVFQHTLSEPERRQKTAQAYGRAAWKARSRGDYGEAFGYYVESLAKLGANAPAVIGLLKLLPHRILTAAKGLGGERPRLVDRLPEAPADLQ